MSSIKKKIVDFVFFNGNVLFESKSKMMHALKNKESDKPLKRTRIDSDVIHQKDLQDFVTNKARIFFKVMDLLSDFLETNVTNWNENKSSSTSTSLAILVKGFNFEAGRGIPITNEYNKL